jgi:hypothetical protein
LNINIPTIEAMVRLEFMNQHNPEYVGRFVEVQIFAVASIPSQTPLFHFLCPDGGVWWRMPIHAFCWKECPARPLEDLVLWDSFSYQVSVFTADLLRNKRVIMTGRNKLTEDGQYLFTLDWFGGGFAEVPGQHKSGHVIKLNDGNFAIQPNNRIRVFDPNFTYDNTPIPRKIANKLYTSEGSGKWRVSNDDEYEYGVETITSIYEPVKNI